MRGSPLIRALIAFLIILVLGVPLWRLTRAESDQDAPVPPAPSAPADSAVRLQLTFTSVPTSVKVLHLGQEVWRVESPAQDVEKELRMEYPKEGVDLQFDVEWRGDALAAMKVVFTDPEGTPHEKSVWGRGSVSEVLTFP